MIQTAKIINTRGLKGECKLYLYTDEPEHRFEKGRTLYLEDGLPLTVEKFSIYKGLGYAFFKGVDTIEEAEKLKNKILYTRPEDIPEAEDGEYYYHQLAGCKVFNDEGEELGTVSDILETGAHLVLRVTGGEKDFLLPFVDAFVTDVDVHEKKMHIKEMEGLR